MVGTANTGIDRRTEGNQLLLDGELAVGLHHLLLGAGHDRQVAKVFHRELSLALGHSTELRGVCAWGHVSTAAEVVASGRRTSKHVVQADFSGERELLVANIGIDDGALALVDTTDDTSCSRESCQPEEDLWRMKLDEPWNSRGATMSTFMTGSRTTGRPLGKASLKAPWAARRKASSDESTWWAAPSSRTNLQPLIGCPVRIPRSRASLNPCSRPDQFLSRVEGQENQHTFITAGMYEAGMLPPIDRKSVV